MMIPPLICQLGMMDTRSPQNRKFFSRHPCGCVSMFRDVKSNEVGFLSRDINVKYIKDTKRNTTSNFSFCQEGHSRTQSKFVSLNVLSFYVMDVELSLVGTWVK